MISYITCTGDRRAQRPRSQGVRYSHHNVREMDVEYVTRTSMTMMYYPLQKINKGRKGLGRISRDPLFDYRYLPKKRFIEKQYAGCSTSRDEFT